MSRTIYIALLLNLFSNNSGLDDVINLINSLFPSNTLIIEKYLITNAPLDVPNALNNFFLKYPPSLDQIILSETTTILLQINNYLEINKLNILSISLSASSTLIKELKNTLTYAYFNQYEVMSYFMLYKDYQMKHFKILYQEDTQNKAFFNDIINQTKFQGNLLNIQIDVEILEINKNYKIKNNTAILLLVDPELINKYVNDNFLNQIPSNSYVQLTDINDTTNDIFKDVVSFVSIPVPLNYTTTTQLVYNSLKNKKNYSYKNYSFFDILYTLEFISTTIVPLTIRNYISINPFSTIPAAWTNSNSFTIQNSGSLYGTFDFVFTKDVIIGDQLNLFNKVNNGGTALLPQSQSLVKTIGIVPFFVTNIYYCEQNYHKIYNYCGDLIAIRFDKNNTVYNNGSIVYNTAEDVQNKFLLEYNSDGYFIYLEKIINLIESEQIVNSTMSKKITYNIVK
jgi:hypothetical protein